MVIVEGTAIEHVAPPQPLADAILAGYAKYKAAEDYEASADHWTEGGLWELRPVKAFAWSVFPDDMTRFRFDAGVRRCAADGREHGPVQESTLRKIGPLMR